MPIDICGLAPLLSVFDMPASLHFYRDLLGFEVVGRSQPDDHCGWALLRLNGIELMLNTAYDDGQRPPTPDPARLAAHSDTALFFGLKDLDGAYRHLLDCGLAPEEPFVQGYGMKQLYLKDPDGYTLCFQWPASEETLAQWRDWYGPTRRLSDAVNSKLRPKFDESSPAPDSAVKAYGTRSSPHQK